MENKKYVTDKYTGRYWCIGLCLGASAGFILAKFFYPDKLLAGVSFGITMGSFIGINIGDIKDRILSKKAMVIGKIESLKGSSNIIIHVNDRNEIMKQYTVTDKIFKREKFTEGDIVAEERNGSLVSLERKWRY